LVRRPCSSAARVTLLRLLAYLRSALISSAHDILSSCDNAVMVWSHCIVPARLRMQGVIDCACVLCLRARLLFLQGLEGAQLRAAEARHRAHGAAASFSAA
jgi:hypothetical protein